MIHWEIWQDGMSWSLRGVSFFPESGGVIPSFQGMRSRRVNGMENPVWGSQLFTWK